ncbi:MAG: DUF1848 domain-containing protein [Bradymonadales bacterium]|nr:DUF1848 domain-containing protein [Bradymonadales bacterium]
MIISASRRTDIPAFYSPWLLNRIRAGFCLVPNPFNTRQIRRVSLLPEEVDALVFWSKNPKPMMPILTELEERGFFYLFLFTLNDYPIELEPAVPPLEQRIETFRLLADRLGAARVIWRYDPILITPVTGYDFHATAFERLVQSLQGATGRVMVSIVDLYRKTVRRMAELKDDRFVIDHQAEASPEMRQVLGHMAQVAQAVGIEVLTCAEETDYSAVGVRHGACIDADLLASLGVHLTATKDPGQRAACRCAISRDIGMNDSCLHGCVYCYATRHSPDFLHKTLRHDPDSPFLLGSTQGR